MRTVVSFVFLSGMTLGFVRVHFYVKTPMTWKNAQSYCRRYYSDLSTIDSEEENQRFIQAAGGQAMSPSWIGLYRVKHYMEGWEWSDGHSGSFFKWGVSQPNNWMGAQDCVVINFTGWNDLNCDSTTYPFFCYKRVDGFVLVKENKTWEEAMQYCRANNTDLASLSSETEVLWVQTKSQDAEIFRVWTGLRFLAGEWLWVNGEPLVNQISLPSCPAQPFHCGALNTSVNQWENRDCEERLNFVCYAK